MYYTVVTPDSKRCYCEIISTAILTYTDTAAIAVSERATCNAQMLICYPCAIMIINIDKKCIFILENGVYVIKYFLYSFRDKNIYKYRI